MRTPKALALLLVALAGCEVEGGTVHDFYSCEHPDKGHKDANGKPDPCHYNDPDAADAGNTADSGDAEDAGDAGDAEPPDAAGETCPGVCVPGVPGAWDGPAFFWMGAKADAPLCGDVPGLPLEFFTGHADLDGPLCGTCTCAPPLGSCALPAKLTVSSGICPGNGSDAEQTPFGPPPQWKGGCTKANAIPAGKLCGGVPCVQSVTIAPLTLTLGGCLPITPPPITPPTWKTFTRACSANASPQPCSTNAADVCMPVSPSAELRLCTSQSNASTGTDCPPGYPDKKIFYNNAVDTLACSTCTCSAPIGSTCTGSLSIFQDGVCGAPLVISVGLDAIGGQCHDVSPGAALGSMSASEPFFTPGTCKATGGELTAGSSPLGSTVVCCQGTP